jgi:diguanylate cyclase (GGDEF)-like protein
VVVPVIVFLMASFVRSPTPFLNPELVVWVIAIAVVDLLPVPTNVQSIFSLSFPLELSVALLYGPAIGATVTFLGSSDIREIRREQAVMKGLFNRAQIALSTIVESLLFHSVATSVNHSHWYLLIVGVLVATVGGYSINTLAVAFYFQVSQGMSVSESLREMHVGIFGEFLLSYMALALFSVLVATTFVRIGPWSIIVFIAPLAFARQMFSRTHSLMQATDELAQREREKEYASLHDALTDLPNRSLFMRRIQEVAEDAHSTRSTFAVMLMDLDHFKEVNDTLGHHFGDVLLQQVGKRLAPALRDNDLMARLGGDEFGVVLPTESDSVTAERVAMRILEELEDPLMVEGLALDVAGSIGIAVYPDHSDDPDVLLRRADVAMYAAKEQGGGWEVYSPSLDTHSPERLTLAGQVRPAIDNREFVVYYQPKIRVSDGTVIGVEALVRWEHPDRGLVPPDKFVPLVERTVLLRPLTHYIMNEACRQWREWANAGRRLDMAVNISPRSLLDGHFPEQVTEVLDRWGVPPEFLTLELTESFLMESGRSSGVLERLDEIGVTMSIDDFGTGYSSLTYLKRLPIREIKIDRTFVMAMRDDVNDAMIVGATVDLGRNLGMRVVAEGVEDRETWERLVNMACDEAQGYLWSRPLPPEAFWGWLDGYDPSALRQERPVSNVTAFPRTAG